MRIRFTTRRMMIVVAVAAVVLTVWVAIDRRPPEPYRTHLSWCRDPSWWFYEWPTGPGFAQRLEPSCLLKIADPGTGSPQRNIMHEHYYRLYALAPDGNWRSDCARPWSTGGSWGHLEPEKLAEVRAILANLPPAAPPSSWTEALIVTSDDNGWRTTRVYDKSALPKEVRRLLETVRFSELR